MKAFPFKQLLLLLMALILSCSAASCAGFSGTEYAVINENITSADGFVYDKYENSTVRITGMESLPAILRIPEKIDGMPVVEITDEAFADNEKLFYVEFPNTSIKLGERVFGGSVALLTVNFSGAVTAIPANTFEGCTNLVAVENAESVIEIATQAFADCSSLSRFSIPSKLEKLGAEAFRGCTSLASVVIPESVTDIAESVFWGCTSLVSAEIHSGTAIPSYCFLNCNALTRVLIGDKVTAIGEESFRGCRALYSVEIGSGITEIADYAFHACDELTDVKLPSKYNIKIGEGNESLGIQG